MRHAEIKPFSYRTVYKTRTATVTLPDGEMEIPVGGSEGRGHDRWCSECQEWKFDGFFDGWFGCPECGTPWSGEDGQA